jgi:hypothetical protein
VDRISNALGAGLAHELNISGTLGPGKPTFRATLPCESCTGNSSRSAGNSPERGILIQRLQTAAVAPAAGDGESDLRPHRRQKSRR